MSLDDAKAALRQARYDEFGTSNTDRNERALLGYTRAIALGVCHLCELIEDRVNDVEDQDSP